MSKIFGHIAGIPVGTVFANREELSKSGIHIPLRAGISGSQKEGAVSIVVSGGYEDDQDFGSEIIYTGHGGQDRNSGKQVFNQEFTRGNKALAINNAQGFPVRVIRGSKSKSEYAPSQGFRYDGLFRVDEYWHEIGRAGFIIWRYRLVSDNNAERNSQKAISPLPAGNQAPKTKPVMTTRVIRSSEVALAIKNVYEFSCQICGVVLNTPGGPYAEGAHIKPLGAPHLGPDTPDNILCLCPNHHVLFDCGAIKVDGDMRLIGAEGRLKVDDKHIISADYLQYHREHFGSE